ncbi:MAG: class I SAM-dependent methyltransferase [Dehalococcoidia bacterium]
MPDPLRPPEAEALAEWARRVRLNREQVDSVREVGDGSDFYAPVAAAFKADPHRTDEPALDLLRSLVQPGDTVLDIGAGGGRYALPLALVAREVIALDPSDGMLAILREGMAEHGIANVRIIQDRWPSPSAPICDVALICHVGYDIEDIGPFLDAMEAHAARLCVAVLLQRQPASLFDQFWPAVHGIEREPLPALPEFLALLLARKKLFEVRIGGRRPPQYGSMEGLLAMARRQLWVEPGTPKDETLQRLLQERAEEHDGQYGLGSLGLAIGVVTWATG